MKKSLSRIVTLYVTLFTLLALFVGVSTISYYSYQNSIHSHVQFVEVIASKASRLLSTYYEDARVDLEFLHQSQPVQKLESELAKNKTLSAKTIRNVQTEFTRFLKLHPFYEEARVIGVSDGGRELVRVNNYKEKIEVIPQQQLQKKAQRDYVIAASKVDEGGVYFGPVTLRRESYFEGPQIDTPQFRILKPIYFEGKIIYFLSFNISFKKVIVQFAEIFNDSIDYVIYNKDGFVLNQIGFDKHIETFGFEFGQKPNLITLFPELKNVAGGEDFFVRDDLVYVNYTEKSNSNTLPQLGFIVRMNKGLSVVSPAKIIFNFFLFFIIFVPIIVLASSYVSKMALRPFQSLLEKMSKNNLISEDDMDYHESAPDDVRQIVQGLTKNIWTVKKHREFLDRIFEKSMDGICVIDFQGRIIYLNSAIEETFGHIKEELVGKNIKSLMFANDAQNHDSYLKNYFVNGTSNALRKGRELIGKHKDGSKIPIFLTVGEIRGDSKEDTEFFGVVRDLSKERRVEKELEKQKKFTLMASRFASLGKVAAGIAHEVNSPLQNVLLSLDMMDSMIQMNQFSDLRTEVKSAAEEIKRISKITNTMKALARQDIKQEPEKVLLNPIVREVIVLYEQKIKLHQIEISVDLDATESFFFLGNRVELQQIIVNLISNAIDSISDLKTRDGKIELLTTNLENSVCLFVNDSGKGVDTDLQDFIFDPLFTTKEVGRGTGLGLSISKILAERNHLRLSYAGTNKGRGAKFCVEFLTSDGRA